MLGSILFWSQFILAVGGTVVGAYIFLRPQKCIDGQIAFYRRINWDIKPISMEREVRTTRYMGEFVLISGVLAIVYIVARAVL